MARTVETQTRVGRSPDVWWGLLIEPRSWPRWWEAVRFARTTDLKPLREGSGFEAHLETGRLRATLRGTVELCADGRALAFRGRWLGLPLRHEWYVERAGEAARLTARTTFRGPAATFVLVPLRLHRRWAAMLAAQGRGLKRLAEQL